MNDLSEVYKINWYLHEPTKNYLDKYKIALSRKINVTSLPHDEFILEIKKSSLVITDGGSIQEECYLLNKPTVLWRKKPSVNMQQTIICFYQNLTLKLFIHLLEKYKL